MTTEPLLRPAVRAVILDREHRVLLVRFTLPHRNFWATPGGGIEPGETHPEALGRELAEEVGAVDVAEAVPVWTRRHLCDMSGGWDGQEETFYLVRVDDLELRPGLAPDALRAEGVTGAAWWTLAELAASGSRFAPSRLPDLVGNLVAFGAPAAPSDVGV